MEWTPDEDEHLAAAVVEAVQIEQQKKEWEMERFIVERSEMKSRRLENADDDELTQQLTYSSEDSKNQVNDVFNSKIIREIESKGHIGRTVIVVYLGIRYHRNDKIRRNENSVFFIFESFEIIY